MYLLANHPIQGYLAPHPLFHSPNPPRPPLNQPQTSKQPHARQRSQENILPVIAHCKGPPDASLLLGTQGVDRGDVV